MQHCEKGGSCNWHVPAAVRDYIDSLQASHEELVKALRVARQYVVSYSPAVMISDVPAIDAALANAAGLCRVSKW